MADDSLGAGPDKKLMGPLCYVLGWVTGAILWFAVPKTNTFIRFHALQSIIFSVVLMIIFLALSWVPAIGWVINGLVGIVAFVLWVFLMVQAFQGKMYKLPFIGDWADKMSK